MNDDSIENKAPDSPDKGKDGDHRRLYSILITMSLPLLFVVAYGIYVTSMSETRNSKYFIGEYEKIYWPILRDLDYTTGLVKPKLASLEGKKVALPGFIVPLDDESAHVQEFLLVPSPKACIHVPPPPPNQMVMIRMKGDNIPKREWGPVWIMGVFRIETSESGYGKVSFLMLGETAERYQMDEE